MNKVQEALDSFLAYICYPDKRKKVAKVHLRKFEELESSMDDKELRKLNYLFGRIWSEEFRCSMPQTLLIHKCPACKRRFHVLAVAEGRRYRGLYNMTLGFCPYCGEAISPKKVNLIDV